MSVDLARTKAKIRRFRSGITFRKTSLMLGKQKTQRRLGVKGRQLLGAP